MNGGPQPEPVALSDTSNSACDLRIPHKQAIAALLLGTVTEATGAKWMEENFLEIERWVRYVRLNGCMSSASPECSGFAHVTDNLGDFDLNVDATFNTVTDLTFIEPTTNICADVASINEDGKLVVADSGWYYVGGQIYVDVPAGYTRFDLAGMSFSSGPGYLSDMRYWGAAGPGATHPVNMGAQLVYLVAGEELYWQGVTSIAGTIYSITLWIHRADCGCGTTAPDLGGGGPA